MASLRMSVSTRNNRGIIANVFSRAQARTQREARRVVKKFGERQFELTRELAPVDTGFLRSQIRLRVSDDGLVYEVGVRASDFEDAGLPFYAVFQEFGTRFHAAQPFIFPARDAIAPQFRSELSKVCRRAWARKADT